MDYLEEKDPPFWTGVFDGDFEVRVERDCGRHVDSCSVEISVYLRGALVGRSTDTRYDYATSQQREEEVERWRLKAERLIYVWEKWS